MGRGTLLYLAVLFGGTPSTCEAAPYVQLVRCDEQMAVVEVCLAVEEVEVDKIELHQK